MTQLRAGYCALTDPMGARGTRTPSRPNFFHFHVVLGKNWPNNRLVPPFGFGGPSLGNPESATAVTRSLLRTRKPHFSVLKKYVRNNDQTTSMCVNMKVMR